LWLQNDSYTSDFLIGAKDEMTVMIDGNEVIKKLEVIKFSDQTWYIPSNICYRFKNLKRLFLGKNIKEIGISAFSSASTMTDVYVPFGFSPTQNIGNEHRQYFGNNSFERIFF
jgi:hypothetical protein